MSEFEQWVTAPLLQQDLSFEVEQPSDRVYDVLNKNHLLDLQNDEKATISFINQLQVGEFIEYITEINTALGGHYYREPVTGFDEKTLARALGLVTQITNLTGKAKFLANLIDYNDFFSSDNGLTARIFEALFRKEKITQQLLRKMTDQESELAKRSQIYKNFLQRELAKQVVDQRIFNLAQNIQLSGTKESLFFDLPALAWTQLIDQRMLTQPDILDAITATPSRSVYLTADDRDKQIMEINLEKIKLSEDDFLQSLELLGRLKNQRLELFCDIYQNPTAHQLASSAGQVELKQLFS